VASRLSRSTALVVMGLLLALMLPVAFGTAQTNPFFNTWARTDQPVNDLVVSRTWVWGPLSTAYQTSEPYLEAPDGERVVMYFDKSRMEINDPEADPDALWYVTNGLLALEMIRGDLQLGDAAFAPQPPAEIPVAGDPDDTGGPTYATFNALLDTGPHEPVEAIITTVDRAGTVSTDERFATYGVGTAQYVPETDHWVAEPFWTFVTSEGIVWENGEYVTVPLFENPYYAVGYPVTEAYWARVKVAGAVTDVLVQCFERRCLTYTPANAAGWQIEMGNIGRHYYFWRYGHDIPGPQTATVYVVNVGDGGPVGCGDSLVGIQQPVYATDTTEEAITAALEALFNLGGPNVGESGLTNALYQSDLAVDSVSIDADGIATVELSGTIVSGGVCDDPRIEAQIRETVLGFEGVTDVVVLLNGEEFPPPLV
jgi:hypothetical protein